MQDTSGILRVFIPPARLLGLDHFPSTPWPPLWPTPRVNCPSVTPRGPWRSRPPVVGTWFPVASDRYAKRFHCLQYTAPGRGGGGSVFRPLGGGTQPPRDLAPSTFRYFCL